MLFILFKKYFRFLNVIDIRLFVCLWIFIKNFKRVLVSVNVWFRFKFYYCLGILELERYSIKILLRYLINLFCFLVRFSNLEFMYVLRKFNIVKV